MLLFIYFYGLQLAWHPEKENLVAFGTDEGRIGIFDTNGKKPPLLYRQYYRNNVYTLSWAPWPNQPDKYSLFACGDGEIVYYDPEKPNKGEIFKYDFLRNKLHSSV